MSTITEQEVHKIARLARLEMSANDLAHHVDSLTNVLNFVAEINAINTDSIEPYTHSQNLNQRMREDEVTECDQRELFQSIAPEVENGLYLVPKVITTNETK